MKTPLRYPGGKSRAVPKLCQWLPAEITEYREPFLGGGSMAIEMTKRYPDLSIWVNDLYKPLYLFWLALRDDGDYLYDQLIQLKQRHPDQGSAKQLFLDAKDKVNDDDLGGKYEDGLKQENVKYIYSKKKEELPTGTCLILVTPDSERTMLSLIHI